MAPTGARIETARLILRPPEDADADTIEGFVSDAEVALQTAAIPHPYPKGGVRDWIRSLGGALTLVIARRDNAAVIGGISLAEPQQAVSELGYWIARNHWGRGYATEAARGALEIARALGHGRVLSGHFVDNPASGRVLRKLGFRETGEVRPTECRARGGEMVLTRRYALDLAEAELAAQGDRMRVA